MFNLHIVKLKCLTLALLPHSDSLKCVKTTDAEMIYTSIAKLLSSVLNNKKCSLLHKLSDFKINN